MKYFYLFILSLLCFMHGYPQITFEKTFGTIDDDEGAAIEVCDNGTYILTGTVDNIYTGEPEVYIARINIYGDTIWTSTFSRPYKYDVACDVIETSDQGFVITGYTYAGDTSMPFLLKYDKDGRYVWFREYKEEVPDGYGYAVVEKPDSGFMVCGRRDYYNADWYHRPFMLETDKDGQSTWSGIFTFGTYCYYDAYTMCLSPENDYILCGYYEDPTISTIEHAWAFKVESGMNVAWNQIYGPSDYTAFANDIDPTDDGGYLICGSRYHGELPLPGTDYNIYLIKINSSGGEEWSKSIGYEDRAEHGRCVDKTLDGGYIIGSYSDFGSDHDDIWLLKTDMNGDTTWTHRYGGGFSEGISDICTTPDGGFLFCGYTESYGLGGSDIYLVKTNENGLLTGIDEEMDRLTVVEVAPNPGNGVFHLRNCPEDLKYMIYDVNARIIAQNKPVSGSDEIIDIRGVSPGIYIIQLISSSQTRSVRILVNP